MLKRIYVPAVAAAALSATLLAVVPAYAEDHRPCVSLREFRGTKPGTKFEIETRWDVRGQAKRAPDYDTAHRITFFYPACGYNLDEGWVFVAYTRGRHHRGDFALRSLAQDATLHGQA